MNADGISALIGKPAPDFTLPRTLHTSFALRDVQGRPAIIVFYPGDWDPVSSEQLSLYKEHLPELQRFEATLIAISVDSVWSHEAFGRSLGLSYPLLSDFQPKGQVSRAYQVYSGADGRSGRALFVLDRAGVIRWSRCVPASLNPGVSGALSALEALHFKREAPPKEVILTIDRSE